MILYTGEEFETGSDSRREPTFVRFVPERHGEPRDVATNVGGQLPTTEVVGFRLALV